MSNTQRKRDTVTLVVMLLSGHDERFNYNHMCTFLDANTTRHDEIQLDNLEHAMGTWL